MLFDEKSVMELYKLLMSRREKKIIGRKSVRESYRNRLDKF